MDKEVPGGGESSIKKPLHCRLGLGRPSRNWHGVQAGWRRLEWL